MIDVEEGIKDILEGANIGTFAATSGWGIHLGGFPQSDNPAIAVMSTGGQASNPKWKLDRPSVQVLIRGNANGRQEAKTKAYDVKNALLGLPSQDINGDRWVQINMVGDVNPLGFDENHKPLFSVNFGLIVEPSTGTHRETL